MKALALPKGYQTPRRVWIDAIAIIFLAVAAGFVIGRAF